MNRKRRIEKQWRDATIKDNFVFGKTMEMYPDLCRQLLELILRVKIKAISYPEREKTIEARTDGKGIRLDVYVEDKNSNRSFDVEMQISNSDNLAKRMRYYQGLIDTDKLKRGQHYSSLGESFIIFICPFDRFKQGRHFYSFCERCDQDTNLKLNDGAVKIFLSTKGLLNDVSTDIKAFLDYVDSGIISGKFVEELDKAVVSVKNNEKVGLDFMTFQMYLLEHEIEAEERGRIEGRNEAMENVALKMIRRNKSFDEIHEVTDLPFERIQQLAGSTEDTP
jgi:predicted transposase/invertase (TIGR01784 family)